MQVFNEYEDNDIVASGPIHAQTANLNELWHEAEILMAKLKFKIPDAEFGFVGHNWPCGILEHAYYQNESSILQTIYAQLTSSLLSTRWAILFLTSEPFEQENIPGSVELTDGAITVTLIRLVFERDEKDPKKGIQTIERDSSFVCSLSPSAICGFR